MKKYELTNKTINYNGTTLYRIKALRDFGGIKAGDLGGFIQSELNLSHEGLCWVFSTAKVFGDARVFGDAKIYGDGRVFDKARVSGDARVLGNAKVFDNARVFDNAKVFGDARVFGVSVLKDYDEVQSTRDYVTLQLRPYNITITRSKVHVGCNSYDFDEFEKVLGHEDYNEEQLVRQKMLINLAIDEIMSND